MLIFNTDDTVTLDLEEYMQLNRRAVVHAELEFAVAHAHVALFGPDDAREEARQDFAHAVRRWQSDVATYRREVTG
jgi:hypothetical protein